MSRSLVPEYEQATRELFRKTVNIFMRTQNPVLAGMREEQVSHLPQESAPRGVAVGDVQSFEPIALEGQLDQADVFTVNTERWITAAWNAAEKALHDLMPQLYASMDAIATRNNMFTSGKGEGFSWDQVIDALEKMYLTFDEQGKPNLQLVLPPDLARIVAETPMTKGQEQRWEEVMLQKRREADARRRHRRLA